MCETLSMRSNFYKHYHKQCCVVLLHVRLPLNPFRTEACDVCAAQQPAQPSHFMQFGLESVGAPLKARSPKYLIFDWLEISKQQ